MNSIYSDEHVVIMRDINNAVKITSTVTKGTNTKVKDITVLNKKCIEAVGFEVVPAFSDCIQEHLFVYLHSGTKLSWKVEDGEEAFTFMRSIINF
jgi:hypothetical protein